MSDDELTFASAGVAGIHYARCEPCMYGSHPGGWHGWAGPEDIEHAAKTGQSDPSGKRCACDCTDGPELDLGPDEPDWDDPALSSMACPVCGSESACAYDSEGRGMYHAYDPDEEERVMEPCPECGSTWDVERDEPAVCPCWTLHEEED